MRFTPLQSRQAVAALICLFCHYLAPSHSFQQSTHIQSHHPPPTTSTQLHTNEPQEKPPLPKTQQQTARSAELKRRQSRIQEGFATPGITSAIPGADNYPVEPSITEREYFASIGLDATSLEAGIVAGTAGFKYGQVDAREIEKMDELEKEKQVALHTTLGLTHLRSLRLRAAYDSFAYVYALNPEAYLWQFGLLQYYFGEYAEGRQTCHENAMRYEAKFGEMGEVASEERIWRDACRLKIRGKKKKMNADDESLGDDEEKLEMNNLECERRKAIRLARQLFSSSVHNNPSKVAMTRVQLQSMCQDDDESASPLQMKLIDPKMYKLHSYFYLGLHYDALGQVKESKQCMKMALKTCASGIGGNNQDITYLLPVIHMTVRDWYDDDNFEDTQENEGSMNDDQDLIEQLLLDGAVELPSSSNENQVKVEDNVAGGIRESIKQMRIVELRAELKKRKLKVGGSKKELQDRLVNDIAREMKSQ